MSISAWEGVLVLPVSARRDHIRGPVDAPVTIVEYGDYECPFCAAAHDVVAAVQTEVGDDMRYVFRNFPLTTMHPHAFQAAEAAEAAGTQGAFWPMHDLLFADQERLAIPDLLSRARALQLDVDRFQDDLATHRHAPRIQEDFMSGVRSGVNGTPTFFVNGVRHDGGFDYPTLLAAVRQAG